MVERKERVFCGLKNASITLYVILQGNIIIQYAPMESQEAHRGGEFNGYNERASRSLVTR